MLYSNFQLKNLNLRNRIVMAPMVTYLAKEDGVLNDWHKIHYLTRVVGGVGLIIQEATAVSKSGRISDNDLGIWDDKQIDKLKELVDLVHEASGQIGIQLAHAGRKSLNTTARVIAPSNITFPNLNIPEEMNDEDIKSVIQEFKNAAKRADTAGYDFIEIHGAHGYLINQFLSPITNKRSDQYGGCLENRIRFLKEIIIAIRTVWKEKALGLRVSAEEYLESGLHPEDLAEIINYVKDEGIDIINVSSGGIDIVSIPTFPGYQLEFAKIIKENTSLPVMGGGLIVDVIFANKFLENQQADLIYFGRELLRNPYFALNSAKLLNVNIEWPKPYERAIK